MIGSGLSLVSGGCSVPSPRFFLGGAVGGRRSPTAGLRLFFLFPLDMVSISQRVTKRGVGACCKAVEVSETTSRAP